MKYWVGGTGNWSDPAHWSASTGGTGGEAIPTSSDDITIDVNSGGGIITLDTDAAVNIFYQESCTFNANNHNISASRFEFLADIGKTPIVKMGSGIWEVTGVDYMDGFYMRYGWVIQENSGYVTLIPQTSTIKFTDESDSERTLAGSDAIKTYFNVWFAGSGNYRCRITSNNIFHELKVTNPPKTLAFYQETTNQVRTFNVKGEADKLITLEMIEST